MNGVKLPEINGSRNSYWQGNNTHTQQVSLILCWFLKLHMSEERAAMLRGRPEMMSSFRGRGGQPKGDEK